MANLLVTFMDVLSKIGGILAAILMLLAMVTIHELGHYLAGKALGFKITEFAVGFGPAIFKKRSKKTGEKFSVRLLPLGGYCAFDGEDDDDDAYGGYYENLRKRKEEEEAAEIESLEDQSQAIAVEETSTERTDNVVDEKVDGEGEKREDAVEEEAKKIATLEEKAEIDALFTEILGEPSAPEEEGENAEKKAPTEEKKEDDYPEPKGERFNNQPPWKRIIVLVAGATMNYLLALVLTIVMIGVYGAPRYQFYKVPAEESALVVELSADGFEDENESENIGGGIFEGGDLNGTDMALRVGDILLEINGVRLYLITDYQAALDGKRAGDTVWLTVLRDGEVVTYDWQVKADVDFSGMNDTNPIFTALGVTTGYGLSGTYVRQGFFETIGASFEYSFKLGGVILRSFGELFTGKVGCDSLGGPVTTITATADVATRGFDSYLNMAALIGVNLAIFNLLPVPALDGSKVVFCIIEWIRKKPLNRKVEAIIHFAGIIVIFGFAILVDILHLF